MRDALIPVVILCSALLCSVGVYLFYLDREYARRQRTRLRPLARPVPTGGPRGVRGRVLDVADDQADYGTSTTLSARDDA